MTKRGNAKKLSLSFTQAQNALNGKKKQKTNVYMREPALSFAKTRNGEGVRAEMRTKYEV